MKRKTGAIILILMSVILVDVGQLLLKKGMNEIGSLDFSISLFSMFFNIFTNPFVFIGIILFVLSSVTWLLALSKANLSYAFPILSLGYVVVSVLSWYFFGESLSFLRVLGLGVIVLGVFMLSKT